MKLYNPKTKNSFQMQFGFQSPNWNKCSIDNLERQEKNRKKK
tara:strand:- start:1672 stop:1797 length:126 start_codon:yes stop_codon:yes gene_type:complete